MPSTPRWRVLSKRLVGHLPGAVRFQGGAIKNRRITIDAFYGGPPPEVGELSITIGGVVIRVRVNTHALPSLEKGPINGSKVAFTGVHPGAAIAIDLPNGRRRGGICAVFARASDPTTPTHFVTCGHLFPPGATGTDVIAARSSNHAEVAVGTLVVNLLDTSKKPLDVALVELTADGAGFARHGGPLLEDVLPANSIFNLDVHTWRPTLGGFSSRTQTAGSVTNAHIDSSLWPNGFDVTDVIATTGSVSIPGDSGTILAIDPQASTDVVNAIGSCSASDGGQSLFEPLDRAIARLASTVQLTLWRQP